MEYGRESGEEKHRGEGRKGYEKRGKDRMVGGGGRESERKKEWERRREKQFPERGIEGLFKSFASPDYGSYPHVQLDHKMYKLSQQQRQYVI